MDRHLNLLSVKSKGSPRFIFKRKDLKLPIKGRTDSEHDLQSPKSPTQVRTPRKKISLAIPTSLDLQDIPAASAEEQLEICPFKLKLSPRQQAHSPTCLSEKDLFERWNKVNQKLEQIISLKPSPSMKSSNIKEQSIKAYQSWYNIRGNPTLNSSESEPDSEVPPAQSPPVSTIWNDKTALHVKKCFADIAGKIDEMNMNTELLKVKTQNLVRKYGGDEFWKEFIESLYQKIMSPDYGLDKYFSSSNLEMITWGMFQVFNGCATMQFRRRIKAAHINMGITEKEFNTYCDLFESTLVEFGVEERDKVAIMSQIRSMKCLICR
ncbi:unnamed protein product [Blepharisma stoltei]|uniref:Globin n=1 Tax=Blepharisma stoltei TaxID=1481888 RepID=A0AAU9K8Z1_9CILI|nr:unnamed protein product [Blepharisma stoltei]